MSGRPVLCWRGGRSGVVALGDADGELALGVAGGERLQRLGGALERVGVLDGDLERAAVEQLRDAVEVGGGGLGHDHGAAGAFAGGAVGEATRAPSLSAASEVPAV